MRSALQAILIIGGIAAVLIASGHIALGPAFIPGSVPVNPTMDSEDRFYATIFLGFGVTLLWCAGSIEHRAQVIRFLVSLFFLGGCARLISIIFVGPPNPFFQIMTALELLLPPAIWLLLAMVARRTLTGGRPQPP
ncbi:MAG: DUF4345 domain-containing protein [Xanthobacteraceae bacterium]